MSVPSRIRVLFVLRMIGFGGTERQVVELCQAMDKERFDITVALFFHDEGYLDDLRETGVRVEILATKRTYKRTAVWRLIRLVREGDFDIIQTWLPIANFAGGLVARLFSRAFVVGSLRNASPFSLRDVFCVMDLVALHAFCDRVVANSQTGKKCGIEKYRLLPEKIHVIRNGKNFGLFEPRDTSPQRLKDALALPPGNRVITAVGRLARQKGHRHLVEATDILVKKGVKDITVLIVGKPEESFTELKSMIRFFSLEKYVKLLGVRQDIPEMLGISDVFVLPSIWEGLANVLLEAMIAGVPVVASDIEANREVVTQGRTGMLVPARDPSALADVIATLLNDRTLAGRLAGAAQREVRTKYHLSRMVREYEEFYPGICQKGAS